MTIRRYLVAPPQGGGEGGSVDSVNGQTGVVDLDAADVGAQPADTDLTAIAGLTHANDTILQTKSGAWAARTPAQVKTDLALTKADVGLSAVDNTTDLGKPISTLTQTALNGKTALSVDGAFTATYNIDTTPLTPGDLGLAVPPPPAPGHYFYPVSATGSGTSTNNLNNGVLRVAPWLLETPAHIDRLAADITAAGEAGSKLRLGIWADNGAGYPETLLVDAGQINGDSATIQELTVNLQLDPGVYWLGAALQAVVTTQPNVRLCTASAPAPFPVRLGTTLSAIAQTVIGLSAGGQTGAFGPTFPLSATATGTIPRLIARAA